MKKVALCGRHWGQPYDNYWVGGCSCPKQSAYNPIFEYIFETSIPKFCGEEIDKSSIVSNSVPSGGIVGFMYDGKINDIGTHDELLSRNPIYQEVYYSQMKGDE